MVIPPHIQNVLAHFQGVRQTGDEQWMALCPAHDDHNPSLSIGIGEGRQAVLNCFAGCHNLSVLHAVNLRYSDLYPEGHPRREQLKGQRQGRIVATYDYRDADGTVLFQVVRFFEGRKLQVTDSTKRKTRMWRLYPLDGEESPQRTREESNVLW